MVRTSVVLAAGAETIGLLLAPAGPATAVPDNWRQASMDQFSADDPTTPARAGQLSCRSGVVGATSDRHLVYYSVRNGKVTDVRASRKPLGFDVSAFGFHQSKPDRRRFDLNAVAANGVPRRVELTFPAKGSNIKLASSRYDQAGFTPRLFADGYSYTAYSIRGRHLYRWLLTRKRNGDVRYAQRVYVGQRYGGLTSLQAGYFAKRDGRWEEYLYATTEFGGLKLIVVPFDRPKRERFSLLKESGYAGVTELSFGLCNEDPTHTVLVAVDPVADTATWTTIKRVTTRPRTVLRGELTGEDVSWNLTAAF